jgi:peptidyl-prolyl cis-trans isomerase D
MVRRLSRNHPMLSTFRIYLNTWPARVFFLLLTSSFILWGVTDVVRNISHDSSVARVAGHKIEMPELQEQYRRDLAQVTRMLGGKEEPGAEMRRTVAEQAAEQLVTQAALAINVHALGIAVPDAALRTAVADNPAFRDAKGQFNRYALEAWLRNNNLSEQGFLDMLRRDLAQRQVLGTVSAGTVPPDTLVRQVFKAQQEKRLAEAVELPFDAAAALPAPTDAQLHRWWQNHPESFSTPEYRRIKAVVLSAETIAKDVTVSDEELHSAYDQRESEFSVPERRSVQVLLSQDEAAAQKLADQWIAGADWAQIQQAAQQAGAAPAELPDAQRGDFPVPELADAVFATPESTVAPPVHSPLGWHVFRVTKVTPAGTRSFEEVRDELRARVVQDKAADLIYDRANMVEDQLAGGTGLDKLSPDLGLAGVTGTLDEHGNTPAGEPAPIPGSPELRAALIQAAFQAKKDDAPHLTEAPSGANGAQSFFAVAVEDIIAPALKPFEQVADAVRADWTRDAVRHEQEQVAAKLLTAVKGGQKLAEAAAAAGLTARRLPAAGRQKATEGVPVQLVPALFSLKPGEATMVETANGFVVAVLAEIQEADPKADAAGYGQVRDALARTMSEDLQNVFAGAVRDRAHPRMNRAMVDSIAQGGD